MSRRNENLGPGAMSGVSQLHMSLSPHPPSSKRRKRSGRDTSRSREDGSTNATDLCPQEMQAAWASLGHPFVRMCLNEITKRLFSGQGIVAMRGEETQIPSDAFTTFLQRDMAPFARDALDSILATGVVPIAFRKPQTAGLGESSLAPYVPRFDSYIISTWADRGIQRFGFSWSSEGVRATSGYSHGPNGTRDDSVFVAHDFGFDPRLDGHLMSNLHTIARHLSMADELQRLALTAERISSNPPLILPYDSRVDERAEKDFGSSFFAGNPDRCTDRFARTYELDAQRREIFAQELREWEQITGMSARQEFGKVANVLNDSKRPGGLVSVPADSVDFSGAEMPWARKYRLSVTDGHVNHQLPRVRPDYVNLMNQTMDIVCSVLSVPRGLLASDTRVKAGVEAVSEMMHRTINRYADMLGSLMTSVYDHIFGNSDLREELRIKMEQRRKSPFDTAFELLHDRDLFEAYAKTRVRLTFDLPPSTTVESLYEMRNRGIISWPTFARAVLRVNGFSHNQLESEKDPLTKNEQRILLFGKDVLGQPSAQKKNTPSSSSSSPQSSGAKKKKSNDSETSNVDQGHRAAKEQISSAASNAKRLKK